MNEETDASKKSRLSPRILTAIVGIPIVLAIVYVGGWLLALVALLLAAVAFSELVSATKTSSTRIEGFAFGFVAFLFYVLLFANTRNVTIHNASSGAALVVAVTVALLAISPLITAILFYASLQKVSLQSLALTVFAALYISLFAFIPILQSLPDGRTLLWLTLFCVWTGDTLAYFGGRRFGRTKLTPLSPGKSREGAFIGFIGSMIVGALIGNYSAIGIGHGIALGALVGVFAPLGDLAESFWKRELGVKDLGTILPGHGGVLDRCDSLLFAAPVAYFYAKSFLK